jgi:gamma-glutamyl:cysteine ligase YbdK (ATP-grasp superfamily)
MFNVDTAQQRVMEAAFYRQLRERCRPHNNPQRALPMTVGIETEYLIVDAQGQLIPETVRNRILETLSHSSPELGVSTLETHTDPAPLVDPVQGMLQEMRQVEQETITAASAEGCRLVRVGAYPGSFGDLAITQQPDRYQLLMDISHTLHGVYEAGAHPVQIGEIVLPMERCNIMSGCQSIHMNIQLPAGDVAVQLLNKAIEITPYLVALGAHSPIVDCRVAGYKEFRVPIWEPLFTFPNIDAQYGVNTRRTGFPDQYYRDWDDYWRDVGDKLYFSHDTERAFEINMKQFWRAVRLKPCPGKEHDCLLELRALSTQPTLEEDAAFYLLLGGLLHDSSWHSRPLLPIDMVKKNLELASRYGLDTRLYVLDSRGIGQKSAAAIAHDLLDEAVSIWKRTSSEAADLLGLLYNRVTTDTQTPARMGLHLFEQEMQAGHSAAEAAQQVFLSYVIPAQQQAAND